MSNRRHDKGKQIGGEEAGPHLRRCTHFLAASSPLRMRNQRKPRWMGGEASRPGDPPWTPAPALPLRQWGLLHPFPTPRQQTRVLPAEEVKPQVRRGPPPFQSQLGTSFCPQRTAAWGHRSNKDCKQKGNSHDSSSYYLPSAQSVPGTLLELNHNREEEPRRARGSHSQKGTELGCEPACLKACAPPTRGKKC